MNPLLLPELRELIQEKDAQALRDFLGRLHPAHAADLIEGLKPDELTWVLEILPDQKEADIFPYLNSEAQQAQTSGAGRKEIAQMLMHLKPDDRAEFARKLPTHVLEEILPLLASAERHDIAALLSFEEGTIGARMTTDYATLPVGGSCAQALEKVRHEAPNKETIYSLYVVDDDRHLEGVVDLKSLLLAKPETPVKAIMRTEYASIHADEPAEKAADLVKNFDLLAVPVTDHNGRLLGIVTVDDLIDVMEQEATRDILAMGGVEPGALDKPYFQNPISVVVQKRVGWLLLLFVAEMFTGTVLRHFDEAIARVVALSFFIPLLIGTGGNAGSQTVSTIIRSLALKEITPADWPKILARESLAGFILGLLLGIVGFGRSLMWEPSNYQLAFTVGLTLVGICTWANGVAAMIPLFAQRAGMDPTVLSAPLITTVVDATGLIMYFTIALTLIGKLSEPVVKISTAVRDQITQAAQGAPQEFTDQLKELLNNFSGATESHQNEWLFPLIALAVLSMVFFWMSKRTIKN